MAESPKAPRAPTSGMHRAVQPEKPLLASDALREDLAPVEPTRQQMRYWLVGVAAVLAALGLAFQFGVGPPSGRLEAATISFSAAGAVLAVALLPFSYALRAGVSLVLGLGLMVLGFRGLGPLGGIAVDGGLLRDLTRLVALTTLPAALLFRAHYRAYNRARWLLAAALVVTLPFVISEAVLALNDSAGLWARSAAALNALLVVCSLFGFMSSATTGGGSWWAGLVLVIVPIEIGLREFTPLAVGSGLFTYVATAVGVQCAAALAALGLFQLAAARLGTHARDTSLPPKPVPTPLPRTQGLTPAPAPGGPLRGRRPQGAAPELEPAKLKPAAKR